MLRPNARTLLVKSKQQADRIKQNVADHPMQKCWWSNIWVFLCCHSCNLGFVNSADEYCYNNPETGCDGRWESLTQLTEKKKKLKSNNCELLNALAYLTAVGNY